VASDEDDVTIDDIIPEDQPVIVRNEVQQNNEDNSNTSIVQQSNEDILDPNVQLNDNEATDISLNEPDVFEVEKVIKGRYRKNGSIEYLVHWKGYSEKDRTWEPVDNLNQAILDYIRKNPVPMLNLQYRKK
jgi:hypothetical protein